MKGNTACSILSLLIAALTLQSFARVHAATIVENFDAGVFPGSATDAGWTTAWTGAGGTSGLSSADPVNDGGSYYSVVSGSTSTNYSLRRQLDGSIFTNTTAYAIRWDYRLDSDLSSFLNGTDNRLQFGTSVAVGESGSSANAGWLVGVKASGYGGSTLNGYWFFYDNTSTSTNGAYSEANMNSTGVLLEQGKVYSFELEVDPDSRTYSASITVDGDPLTTVTRTGLNFRNQTSTADFLNLYMGQFTTSNAGLTSSIDHLTIDAVPEPAHSTLALLGLGVALVRRRRH